MTIRPSPEIGTRISHSGSLGTIRYVGSVEGTNGTWLGIEWDDPSRGKHDGVKNGKKYFECLVAGSGSFIRPTAPNLDFGKSFLTALVEKYIEIPLGDSNGEYVILGSSNGAIQVEAVNLDKIRGKLSNLTKLRDVSLDKEGVSSADDYGAIRDRCPNLKGVDLSFSLIPSWDVVALVARELPLLERLALNNNRFLPPTRAYFDDHPFQHLVELQLSTTLMSWEEILDVITQMPTLKQLEMGYNRLQSLTHGKQLEKSPSAPLELINLDGNELCDWEDIYSGLAPMKHLSKVILSSNTLTIIPSPSPPLLAHLLPWKYVSLAATRISSWTSLDALAHWCPHLEGLNLYDTYLVGDPKNDRIWRQVAIARLPTLRVLDGVPISDRQKLDAELFYISMVSRLEYASEDERNEVHPRWRELCQKHGNALEAQPIASKDDKLSSRLIQIKVGQSQGRRPPSPGTATALNIHILPSAPLRMVRLKLLKSLKMPRAQNAEIWIRMMDGSFSRIGEPDGTDDAREIGWWLDDGSEVVVCFL